jgi:RNA polymerase sigma-70 factor (ECF subfamily)
MNVELDLITACLNRERRAESELYKITYSYLMSICYRYVNSTGEAKEMLNIGFLKILINLDKYKPEVPFKLWIRRIMINTLIDEYRKKKVHERIQYVDTYVETADYSDLNPVLARMDADQINNLIKKLPPTSQKVFNLFVVDGYSHKEIANMLKMSEGTSKWHVNFSKERLKEMILKIIPTFNRA